MYLNTIHQIYTIIYNYDICIIRLNIINKYEKAVQNTALEKYNKVFIKTLSIYLALFLQQPLV